MTCLRNVALQHLDVFKAVVFATYTTQQTLRQVVLNDQSSFVNNAVMQSHLCVLQILTSLQVCLFQQHSQLLALVDQSDKKQVEPTPTKIRLFDALFGGDVHDAQTFRSKLTPQTPSTETLGKKQLILQLA
jgi:hypothetical protein